MALLGLARSLDVAVIAEGVESAASLGTLCDLGCGEGQGYHLGRPMNADDTAKWLDRPNAAA